MIKMVIKVTRVCGAVLLLGAWAGLSMAAIDPPPTGSDAVRINIHFNSSNCPQRVEPGSAAILSG